MNEDDLPLDDDLRALLRSDDARAEIPAEAFARVRARVDATLTTPPVTPPASPTSASTFAASGAKLAIALVGAFAAGALTTYVAAPRETVRVVERTVEVRVPEVAAPTPSPAGSAPLDEGPRSPMLPVGEVGQGGASIGDVGRGREEVGAEVARATDAGGDTPASDSTRDRALADENALISRAQSALARGRFGEALAATSEHQRRFPRGELGEEREALAIQALARSGNASAAAARADRFRARYPRSMLRRAVDSVAPPTSAP